MSRRSGDGVVWVIGASGTIGMAVARRFSDAGFKVVVSARRRALLRKLTGSPGASGASSALPVDLASRASVDRAVKTVVRCHGRIDVLVNCAAAAIFGDFLELTDAQWNAVLQTKLLGYIRSMRAVIPFMLRQGGGSIVNVTGRGGRQPTPAHLPGCAANIALNLVTKGTADAYAHRNIRINAVAPGPVESARHHQIARSNKKLTQSAGKLPPVGRLGTPEEIAEAVFFLASPGAAFISGVTLQVDGGGTAAI
ncbi:MAG: SDR family oxidoreductase [Burkholderiales bacterium]|nr:SDR family oxidoreductase [Burkholderiales bacterium]